MAVQTISYADKSAINTNPDIVDTNKVNATDMNEIKSVVNNNANELSNSQGTILWTNQNPTNDFSSQTITLSSSDYDYIDIIYNNSKDRNTYESTRVYKSYAKSEIGGTFNYNGKVYAGTRPIEIKENGLKIYFEPGYGSSLANYSFGAHNDWYIPIKIIGYKTGVLS